MPAAPLPPYLARRLADGLTYVTRRDLASAGIDVSTLRAWRRAGFVTPYSYGAYGIVDPCAADMDHFAARRLHHVRRCEALLQTLPGAHLIGGSALVVHRLAVLRFPDRIEVARRPRVQSRRDDFVCRRAWGEAPEQVDGLGVQAAAEAAIEVAAHEGLRAGVVSADSYLFEGGTPGELESALVAYGRKAGVGQARAAVELADGAIESAGESLLRLICRDAGIAVIPQVEIWDDESLPFARVDFLVEGTRVVLEFDGMVKYTHPEALRAEKRREMRLRRLGYVVVRFTWSDLSPPVRLVRTIREAMAVTRAA